MNSLAPPWGGEAIRLQLPGSLMLIESLSRQQRRAIMQDYAAFVVADGEARPQADVVCRIGRLGQPIGFPVEHFLVNGQYAVHQRRSDAGIEIIGFDFVGHFARRGPAPVRAALSVAKEEELARVSVLGNLLRILLAHCVLDRGGVLLHSAGVVYQERAYLFSGRSNAGKTTLARKAAAEGIRILSDDINLVIPEDGTYRAHKVPFTGEFGRQADNISGCGSFPLAGLVLLEQTPTLTATSVSPAASVAGLLAGCPFVNDDPEEFPALLDILTQLVTQTPIIRLGVARDDPFEAIITTVLRAL